MGWSIHPLTQPCETTLIIKLGNHLVNDEDVCGYIKSGLHPPLFPLCHVICVKVDVTWDLHARCEPVIDVVKTSDRSLVLTREVSWFGYEVSWFFSIIIITIITTTITTTTTTTTTTIIIIIIIIQ